MKCRATLSVLCLALCLAPFAASQDKTKEETKEHPAHNELRKLRDGLLEVLKKNDFDALMPYLDDDVVVTFMNAEVARKPAGVKAYFERLTKGDQKIVTSYTPKPEVDELAHLIPEGPNPNTAIATGLSHDTFVLTDGREFSIDVRWTAVLVKKDGKWKIITFHSSANVFDNPIQTIAMKRSATWSGVLSGAGGLLLGAVFATGIGWWLRRRKTG